MSNKTSIEWTDVTDNIIVAAQGGWWCRKISPGCANCYAEHLNQSTYFKGNKLPYTGAAPELKLRRDLLDGWKRQRHPKKHFVASMTDVFGEWVSADWSFEMLDAMEAAPLQTFQVLTKRAYVMTERVRVWLIRRGLERVPKNIWLGFTAENQEWFDRRWEDVQRLLPFKSVLFVSAEPMLGEIRIVPQEPKFGGGIDWIICGGESGQKARPMHPGWARSLRDQCIAAGVPFLFKQWGEYLHEAVMTQQNVEGSLNLSGRDISRFATIYGENFHWLGKKAAGRLLDGREWNEFPEI